MKPNDEYFIHQVIDLAFQSAKKGFEPFAALLVKNEKIVAKSIDKSIPYSDPTAHAELTLISEYCRENTLIDLKGLSLYSFAEPCVMCSGAVHWAKIDRLIFSVSQSMLQEISGGNPKPASQDLINIGSQKTEIIGPVLPEQGLKVLKAYPFTSKRKKHQLYHQNI